VTDFKLLLLILAEGTEENDEANPVTIFLRKFKLETSVHLLVQARPKRRSRDDFWSIS
jgi:hypothetical protein